MKRVFLFIVLIFTLLAIASIDNITVSASSITVLKEEKYYSNKVHDGKLYTEEISKEIAKEFIRIEKEFKKLQNELEKEGKLDENGDLIDSPITDFLIMSCIIGPQFCLAYDDTGGGDGTSLLELEAEDFLEVSCNPSTYYLCRGIVYYSGSITYHEMTVEINPDGNIGHLENTLTWSDSPLYRYEDYMSVFIDEKLDIIISTIILESSVNFTSNESNDTCYSPGITDTHNDYEDEFYSGLTIPVAGLNGDALLWEIDIFGDYDLVHADEPVGFGFSKKIPVPNPSGDDCLIYRDVTVNEMWYTMSFDFILDDEDSFADVNSINFTSHYLHKIMEISIFKLLNGFNVELDLLNILTNVTESFYYSVDGYREIRIQYLF